MVDDGEMGLSEKEERGAAVDRLVAFTDGVFAIIITILVLDIRVPDLGSDQALSASLAEIWPTFVSFVISFLLVGMYWDWHRTVFAQVRYVDRSAVWLNLLFLLPVSLVPFAASALGEHTDQPIALQLYGTVLIAATLMRMALAAYLRSHPGLMWASPSRQGRRLAAVMAAAPLLVYAIAVGVAVRLPGLSLVLYLALPGLYFGLVAFLRADPRTRIAAEEVS